MWCKSDCQALDIEISRDTVHGISKSTLMWAGVAEACCSDSGVCLLDSEHRMLAPGIYPNNRKQEIH